MNTLNDDTVTTISNSSVLGGDSNNSNNINSGNIENNKNNNNNNNNETAEDKSPNKKRIKKNKKLKEKDMDSIVKQYSGNFDSWMAVSHLYKYRDNPGIIDFLCNKLYSLEDKDIDFYITQLCILLINQPYEQKASFSSLARFVLDRCANSIRFAIKAYWIFQAFEEDGEKNLFSIENSVYLQSPSASPKDVPMYSNDQTTPIDLDKIYNQNQYDEEEFIDDSSNDENNDSINNKKINANNGDSEDHTDEEESQDKNNNNSNNNSENNNKTENGKNSEDIVNEFHNIANKPQQEQQPQQPQQQQSQQPTPNENIPDNTEPTSNVNNHNYAPALSTIDGVSHPYISQPNDPIENITQILKRNRKIYNKIEAKKELATRLREFCEMSVITCSRPLITRPRTSSLPSPVINFNTINKSNNKSSPSNNSNNIEKTLISEQDDSQLNGPDNNNNINDTNGGSLSEDEISYLEKCKTPPVESKLSDQDFEFELSKSYRCDYLNDILSFIQKMARISKILLPIPVDIRQAKLKHEISLLNINLPLGLYVPLWQNSKHHCVVRIPPEEVKILNSRDRVPFLLVLEIIESDQEALSSNIFEVVSSYLQYTTTNDNLLKMNEMKRKYFSYLKKNILNSSSETITNGSTTTAAAPTITTTSTQQQQQSKSLPISPANSINSSSNTIISSSTSSLQQPPIGTGGGVPLSTSPLSSPLVEKIINDTSRSLSSPFGESWAEKTERYRRISPYGHFANWKLCSVIVKTGDDCRQEQMAVQLIRKFDEIWKESKLPLYLRPYNILVTSSSGGIIETIPDTISLHNLKKNTPNFTTLLNHFKNTYGEPSSHEFRTAQSNFIESMAAYSIVTYILQIKDRHNGNILIDKEGHIVHIDFGYILSNSPGNISFESAPFKLTQELVDVMGGATSGQFQYFKVLCVRGLIEARKQVGKILSLIEIMMSGPKMSCFVGGKEVIDQLKARFFLDVNERECSTLVENLISYSLDHFKTRYYDKYQSWYNGILP
ncbi:hypothetical protein DICPUDRAFT_151559 [Dictyostelium purpureum]|uniref:1-phosphatidylinositol 4-kinase n=1 Tax=Dictyostelium purpureum TaxID=5786 RepID=F0ZJ56_DICPU|nr:uncharacterized protein DICPUDRAFT_151559 [Dictyostelium purpureum]EGC36017.1 hypothetical protein DICPUDRAFT_151559 [Dictyostelium purpureum]|eukprot:XP_003287455.1 hypothetical protein DICPUDRAFT_151559 [Dictyostelium purpureum]